MGRRVIVIGGGVAGMQAAITLKKSGYSPLLLEKGVELGGKLCKWDRLFPDYTSAEGVVNDLVNEISDLNIKVQLTSEVSDLRDEEGKLALLTTDGNAYEAEAVIIASGFDIFNAAVKEEYGYGVYDNVITSVDLENMFKEEGVRTASGYAPKSVAFLHCVGSRDAQVGVDHCSRVCCITGVKQAIELRKELPDCKVYNFYMDMRMFGSGYEEMYKEAQAQWHVNFIRGRISEASQDIDKHIRIKAEDTLLGRPLKLTVDMLVLLVGMKAPACNAKLAGDMSLELDGSNFFKPKNPFGSRVATSRDNIFVAGTAIAPKNIGEAMNDGVVSANAVIDYLNANQ